MKTKSETLDLTPTWSSLVQTLLVLYTNAGAVGRSHARDELTRMAKLADLYVESQKEDAE